MSTNEIDAEDFIKGLRLLRSRAPESADELKRMLEVYQQRQINGRKRHKEALMFPGSQAYTQDAKQTRALEEDSEATDIEDEVETGACVVCRSMEQSAMNRMIECTECHQRYHAECHKPAVTKKELDTRILWICTKCNKAKKPSRSPLSKPMMPNKMSSSSSQNLGVLGMSSGLASKALKPQESDKLKYSGNKRGTLAPKAASFSSSLNKPSTGNGTGLNRPASIVPGQNCATSSTLPNVNKNKLTTSNSFSSSLNSSNALEKRFPNFKKTKLPK